MRTGLTKKQKTTVIYFDEHSRIIEVQTHNTDLKKRLTAFGKAPAMEIHFRSMLQSSGVYSVRMMISMPTRFMHSLTEFRELTCLQQEYMKLSKPS